MSEPNEQERAAPMADAVFDAIDLPLVLLDEHAKIVRVNAAWSAREQARVGDSYAPADAALVDRVRAVCEGRAERCEQDALPVAFAGHTYRVRAVRAGGTECACVVSHRELAAQTDEIARLQEELEGARKQLLQAQKLESVGRLSGGVAHDFNNMLTSIICFTRFVVDEMVAEDPRRADLIEVLKSADHAARLTNQLLAFSRRKPLQPVPINVNDAVTSVGRVLRRTLGEQIELVIEPSDEALWVSCDPGQFDQLLFNLSVQAKDALPGGGTITIRVGRTPVMDVAGLPQGNYAELSFAHQTLSQPGGEPVTAGAVDQSSGLGLATCRVIAEQALGALLPQHDARGVEAGYRVLLPTIEGRVGVPRRVSLAPVRLAGTVLVVEDQPAILRTMVRALSATGLTVVAAGSAEDALAALDGKPQVHLELVVTDVVLPRMSGPRLAEQLRTKFPDLHVLFVSGYIGEEVAPGVSGGEGTAFVMKPFTGRQLAVRAGALLGQRARRLSQAGA